MHCARTGAYADGRHNKWQTDWYHWLTWPTTMKKRTFTSFHTQTFMCSNDRFTIAPVQRNCSLCLWGCLGSVRWFLSSPLSFPPFHSMLTIWRQNRFCRMRFCTSIKLKRNLPPSWSCESCEVNNAGREHFIAGIRGGIGFHTVDIPSYFVNFIDSAQNWANVGLIWKIW